MFGIGRLWLCYKNMYIGLLPSSETSLFSSLTLRSSVIKASCVAKLQIIPVPENHSRTRNFWLVNFGLLFSKEKFTSKVINIKFNKFLLTVSN